MNRQINMFRQTSSDPGGAKAALDRIAIPQDTLNRIAGMASPRSSLVISDEALSSETGNGTEFVVLISGEPQGEATDKLAGANCIQGWPYYRTAGPDPVASAHIGGAAHWHTACTLGRPMGARYSGRGRQDQAAARLSTVAGIVAAHRHLHK
jgi:hypothetical protein